MWGGLYIRFLFNLRIIIKSCIDIFPYQVRHKTYSLDILKAPYDMATNRIMIYSGIYKPFQS